MKIVFLTENYYCGGLDSFIITLINNWPDPKDKFTLICNDSHPGLDTIKIHLKKPCIIKTHNLCRFGTFMATTKIPNTLKRIIGVLLRYPTMYYYYLSFKKVFRENQFDRLMIINGGYPGGESCRMANLAWGKVNPNLDVVHNFHNYPTRPKLLFKMFEDIIDRRVAKLTKSFISVSINCAQAMNVRPIIFRNSNVFHIYNGIDKPFSDPVEITMNSIRSELGIEDDSTITLMLGTYELRKGHEFLIKSFSKVAKKVSKSHLLICGFGTQEDINRINSIISLHGLTNRVHLKKFVAHIGNIISQSDVVAVSSQWSESFGLVSVEAMSCKKPVVATDIGGIPEVVVNNQGGYCVDHRNEEEFANKIIQLLEDERLRIKQGELGHQRFLRLFQSSEMAREYKKALS